jgi:hypothetical protein
MDKSLKINSILHKKIKILAARKQIRMYEMTRLLMEIGINEYTKNPQEPSAEGFSDSQRQREQ